jgi:uncharacterized Fe-S cluster protein YjdI
VALTISIENIEVNNNNNKKKWNNLLTKTEILYYYNNNDNIHVSNCISGLIFVFVSKNSVLFVEDGSDFTGTAVIFESCQKKIGTATLPCM